MTPAAVVIGRNEGERLERCLASLDGEAAPIVYVDSGSTDGSPEMARGRGVEVIELDMSVPFTAARARNAGLAALDERDPETPPYVQIVDGDCEVRRGWTSRAVAFLDAHPEVAAVAGRLRERHAEASVWNRLADAEWDAPEGEAIAVGGIACLRRAPVREVGGFRGELVAGEEPELCFRLRHAGHRIWRLSDEMALHDIAMTRFSQWWRRMRRGGHAFAELAHLHGQGPERFRVAETRRALIWGAGLPAAALGLALLVSPWFLCLLLAWPAQVVRLRLSGLSWTRAGFLTLAKLAEAQGVADYWIARVQK